MFVQGHSQKIEQKHRTKSFSKLHNHSPLLTIMIRLSRISTASELELKFKKFENDEFSERSSLGFSKHELRYPLDKSPAIQWLKSR